MGSLSFSEIVVIVLVILIVFGPNRLPDLARRAGEFMSKVKHASSSMTDALGVEYQEAVEPILSAKRDYDSIKDDLTKTVTTFGKAVTDPARSKSSDGAAEDSANAGERGHAEGADPLPDSAAGNAEEASPAEVDPPDDSTAST
jgi:TatA/E family protein of Tat protein translocase